MMGKGKEDTEILYVPSVGLENKPLDEADRKGSHR
jgi:hypothetical protein